LSTPEAWVHVGTLHDKKNAAIYKIQNFTDFLYGTVYRFIVCHSSHLDGRKLKALQAAIKRENEQTAKAVTELEAVNYYCAEDAKAALDKFIADSPLEYHSLSGKITVEERVKKALPSGTTPKK
jgi:peptide methionine sulfoxide reductase MsrA